MSSKRPIKAFYVPKRNISQNSSRQLISNSSQILSSSPSFTYSDEIPPPDSPFGRISVLSDINRQETSLDSSSKLPSQESFFLSKSQLKDKEISENVDNKNRKICLAIIVALFIAICLIAVVVLLAFLLKKQGKNSFPKRHS